MKVIAIFTLEAILFLIGYISLRTYSKYNSLVSSKQVLNVLFPYIAFVGFFNVFFKIDF